MSEADLLDCAEEMPPTPPETVFSPGPPGSKVMDLEEHSVDKNAPVGKKKKTPSTKKKSQKKPDQTPSSDNKTPANKIVKRTPKKKTMLEMVHDAIVAMGDRTGSSQIAIAKYIISENSMEDNKTFRSRLNVTLKIAVTNKRFQKIRNSYKINGAFLKKERDKTKRLNSKKREADHKKAEQEKNKREKKQLEEMEKAMSPEELKAHQEKQANEKAAREKKEEAERIKKERAERIKKRRFPMEDTKLYAEDKELGVKPPEDVTRRPALPYFFPNKAASKSDHLEYGSRGMVADLLQVYHFFRGDVHFTLGEETPLVPEFTLKHLRYSVDEVLNGNAKRSRMVPPLISHLFVTCLQLLLTTTFVEGTAHEGRLRKDLEKLAAGLSPASWGEVCALYMDAMERFYASNASVDLNVLPSGVVDIHYLMHSTNIAEPITPAKTQTESALLPDGYCAYLGNPHSALARGQAKLLKQDPWNLSAEELMALLRALTDDILAIKPEIGEDIARRDGEMYELLKAKRFADSQFRKIRLAFEGPKQPSKKKSTEEKKELTEEKEETKETKEPNESMDENKENATEDTDTAPKFKPTATKKQFENAKKAQQKAHDAYEKGLRTLTARTEPVGYDRNHNSVYFFNHDPDMLYVEMSKPSTVTANHLPLDMLMKRYSWHVIDTKSLFDSFVSSLDIRGTRENDLYDAILGPVGGHYSLKRGLYDDLKEESDKAGRVREREDLERRLANARIACQAEEEGGRRSGRLQSRAQIDLCQVEQEIEDLEKRIAADAVPKVPDYDELTGLELLRKFDAVGRRETRRSRERKAAAVTKAFPDMPCTKLISSGNIDDSGFVGSVVSEMLDLEERCDKLSPWERDDVSRDRWIADLEDRVHSWNSINQVVIGPPQTDVADDASESGSATIGMQASKSKRLSIDSPDSSDSKRRRLGNDSPSSMTSLSQASPAQILSLLKKPLLDLEQRVFEITGLAVATHDADEADDNMSAASEDERSRQEQKEKLAWKKKIHALRSIETKRFSQIRELVVEAITAARKAHFGSVVSKLRSALLLHRPNAAGECKAAALAVLDSHGGYHAEDDDSDDESDEEEEINEEKDDVPTLLSAEATMISGSLGGDDDADRVDWIDAVKSCKTLSRWSALTFAFLRNATQKLEKIEEESESLWGLIKIWEKEEQRQARLRTGKTKVSKKKEEDGTAPTEVWANVLFTDEFCMAKVDGFPFWPAKKCEAKDKDLKSSLHTMGRTIVSLIGEDGGLRAARLEDIRPFNGDTIDEDLDDQPKHIRTQLDECMHMARRIVRGRKRNSMGNYLEEKKSAM